MPLNTMRSCTKPSPHCPIRLPWPASLPPELSRRTVGAPLTCAPVRLPPLSLGRLSGCRPITGGDINLAYQLLTKDNRRWFGKFNDIAHFSSTRHPPRAAHNGLHQPG